jgi:flagellar hook protein FlgE
MYMSGSALDAFGDSMQVVGHNIANLNTVGFKASRIEFADLFPTIEGELEFGHGVRVASVDGQFQQGSLETTAGATNLAIDGNGLFVLRDATGGTFYTRAGEFHLDPAQNLVNPEGLFVQGANGNISLANSLNLPGQATSSLNLDFNLDASSTPPAGSFPAGPHASQSAWLGASNFSLIATVYDSLGNAHDLTFLFSKSAPNTWDYRVVAQRSELDTAAPSSTELRQVSAGGTLVFNSDGSFNSGLSTVTDINGLSWVNGASSQTIAAGSLGLSSATQYAQTSNLRSFVQDGFANGALTGIAVDSQGVITGRYSNGNLQVLDTIQLAMFANLQGLDPLGDTLFAPTLDSGAAQVGQPSQGGRGNIVSGALELSTVELAEEFVSMIISQRAFQMNSRALTVADQMYSVATDLKA